MSMPQPSRSLITHLDQCDRGSFDANYEWIQPDRIFDCVYDLHDDFQELYQCALSQLTDCQKLAISHCLQGLRREFMMQGLAHLRGHSIDADNHQRRGLEYCAFVIQMAREPHTAKLWMEAEQSETKFRRYRSGFKIMQVLKSATATGYILDEYYELLSRNTHATLRSILSQVTVFQLPDRRRINRLDFNNDRTPAEAHFIARQFVYSSGLCGLLLQAIASVFIEQFQLQQLDAWNRKMELFLKLWDEEKHRVESLPDA